MLRDDWCHMRVLVPVFWELGTVVFRVVGPAVKPHIAHAEVFVSTNDVLVDPSLTQQLADALSAAPITIHGAGHFLESDGYTEFPQLGDRIAQWLRSL